MADDLMNHVENGESQCEQLVNLMNKTDLWLFNEALKDAYRTYMADKLVNMMHQADKNGGSFEDALAKAKTIVSDQKPLVE